MPNMTIIRPKSNFSVISNMIARDKRVSMATLGLYYKVMCLPDDWDFSVAGIQCCLPNGKDAIYSALRELEQLGYCVREQLAYGGRFLGVNYVFLNEPHPEKPHPEKPHPEKPHPEKPPQLNKYISKEPFKQTIKERGGKKNSALANEKIEVVQGETPNPPKVLKEKKEGPPVAAAPPTIQEATAEMTVLGQPNEAGKFWAYYQAKGWAGIIDWKAAASCWVLRMSQYTTTANNPESTLARGVTGRPYSTDFTPKEKPVSELQAQARIEHAQRMEAKAAKAKLSAL